MKGMFYISYLVAMLVLVVAAEIINFARQDSMRQESYQMF